MKITPHPFQSSVIKKIKRLNGRALLVVEMGLGKTIISLLFAKLHLNQWPVIIICPAGIKLQWDQEALLKFRLHCYIANSKKPANLQGQKVIIINYDVLKQWLPELIKIKPKLLILDECQYCSNWKAQRTKAVCELAETIPNILALSGTPLANTPMDMYAIIRIICPDLFPNIQSFGDRFCNKIRLFGNNFVYKGGRNLKRLHKILKKNLMIRLTKQQAAIDLPPKTESVITLEIDNKKEYNEAKQDLISWLQTIDPEKAEKAQRAERLVKFGYLKRLAAIGKLKALCNWIDCMLQETDQKILIFAIHKTIIAHLTDRYKKISVTIDGSKSAKNRQISEKKFQNRKNIRILIGQTKACGVGLNLTSAEIVLHAELPWTVTDLNQASGRAHRITSKCPVHIYHAIGKDTVEEILCEYLQKKQETANSVLDGKITKDDDINIYQKLQEQLEKDHKNARKR